MITLKELSEKLKQEFELDLVETIGITSEDLVDAFEDKIEQQQLHLIETFGYEDDTTLDG